MLERLARVFPGKNPESKYLVLLATLILVFVLGPFFSSAGADLLLRVLFLAVVLAVVAVAAQDRRVSRLVLALALLPVLSSLVALAMGEESSFQAVNMTVLVAFFGVTTAVILVDVFTATRVGTNEILGAICAYIFVGLMWALIYALLDEQGGGAAIRFPEEEVDFGSYSYFSFVTLATLGYGDVVPVTEIARTFALVEALFGQLYLTVLIARLVGLQIALTKE